MSMHSRLAASTFLATLAFSLAGCRGGIEVRTMVAPDAGLSSLYTFRMLLRDGA